MVRIRQCLRPRTGENAKSAEKLPICPILNINCIMSVSNSAWRALHYSAKRRAFQAATPYRCFSCTTRVQQTKPENDRMTHFGFTNVPESEKETRGKAEAPAPPDNKTIQDETQADVF